MAVKKATTTQDVLAGPPAEGATPTVPVGDPAPETANLTGDGPDEAPKAVKFESPYGTVFTVGEDRAETFKDLGYKVKK